VLSDVAVEVSFMQSSLLRLVDERDEPRNQPSRRFFHQPMACAFDDDSVDVRINQTGLLNQEFSGSFSLVNTGDSLPIELPKDCSRGASQIANDSNRHYLRLSVRHLHGGSRCEQAR
jgi:hypothetical protein